MVNEESYRAHWVKDFVATDRFEDNSFMFVWLDTRLGVPAIYGQRLSPSGTPLGANFIIQTTNQVLAFRPPALACVDSARFFVVWEGQQSGPGRQRPVYVQRFSPDGTQAGPMFLVDTTPFGQPAAAVGKEGRLMIAWPDSHPVRGWTVLARPHNRIGQPLDTAVVVSDSTRNPQFPVVSADPEGRFLVAWQDRGAVMYAQLIDSFGIRIGDSFLVNDSGGVWFFGRRSADAVALSRGRMVFAYTCYQRLIDRMFLAGRIMDCSGGQNGSFWVSDSSSRWYRSTSPSVCTEGKGGLAFAWLDSRRNRPDIYLQRYDSLGLAVGGNCLVNDTISERTKNRLDHPAVVANDQKTIVVWRRRTVDGRRDIMFKVFDNASCLSSRTDYLSDDRGFAHQFSPSVAAGGDGRFFVTWSDSRRPLCDVFAKQFDTLGNALQSDFRVNQDTCYENSHFGSSLASNGSRYVVAWYAQIEYSPAWHRWGVMGQKYALDGTPIDTNFWISDSLRDLQLDPKVAARPSGGYAVTWRTMGEGLSSIMARRLDRNGDPVDTCFQVNELSGWHDLPAVEVATNGQFVIAWGGEHLFFQRFDSAGGRLGTNVEIAPRGECTDVAYDADQNFVITWDAGLDIHAKRFTMAGDSIGPAFRVNDSAQIIDPAGASPAVVCRRPHEFFICYDVPWGWAYQILGQYYKDGSPVGGNRVINQSILDCNLEQPTMTADSERIYIAWAGYKYEQNRYNYDVYAKIIKWDDLVDVEGEKLLQVLDRQFRIYPNPARARVTIIMPDARYMMHDNGKEPPTLKIYDISGRMVKSFNLASWAKDPTAGLLWDGKDDRERAVRSGVYFCQLKAGESVLSKKLVLLR